MATFDADSHLPQRHDKQLQGVTLEAVMEKRRLDQALNAKEFAVCAGVSYSKARSWFNLAGFPVFHGVIFWKDFDKWRAHQYGIENTPVLRSNADTVIGSTLPPRAAQILIDAQA